MEDFIKKMKNEASKVIGEAGKLTGTAVEKTGSFVNCAKLNYVVGANENKIKEIYAEIGKFVYVEYKSGNQIPESILEKMQEIDILYDEINELKTKIADLKKSVICTECGEYNNGENVFCSKCGSKLKD